MANESTEPERVFELRADHKDFSGGSFAYGPEGETVDVKARLDNGKGRISTNDPLLANALAGYPALKEVPAGSAGKSSTSKED